MKSPIVAYLPPFILGILLYEWMPVAVPWWVLTVVLALVLGLLLWGRRLHVSLLISLLAAVVIFVGYALASVQAPGARSDHYVHHLSTSEYEPLWFSVRLVEMPSSGERSVKVVAEVLSVGDSSETCATKGRMMLFLSRSRKSETLLQGDRLLLYASPRKPSGRENPHQFDYARYLRHHGILRQTYLSDADYLLLDHDVNGLSQWAGRLRLRLMGVIHRSALSPSQQAIAEALVLGWRADIDDDTQQQFRHAGVTHLLCVSGLHVGIVAAMIGGFFFFLGNAPWGKRMRGLLQLLGIWFFVLLSGMAPSTLRAAWMFSFVVVGQMFFARPPTLNAVASSALVLLVVRPFLLFDVGFQLSYAAVVGIVLLHRPLVALLLLPSRDDLRALPPLRRTLFRLGSWLWSWVCLTSVAQLSTLPFTLYYFHQFPRYFLVANLTIVPFAGLLLGSIILMMLCGGIPWLFALMARLVSLQMAVMDGVTSWVSSLPGAVAEDLYFDLPMAMLSALILLLLGASLVRRQLRFALLASMVFLLLAGHLLGTLLHRQQQRSWILYSSGRHPALECFDGRRSFLLADSAVALQPSLIGYQRDNLRVWNMTQCTSSTTYDDSLSSGCLLLQDHFLQFGDLSLFWVDRSYAKGWNYLDRHQEQLELPHFPVHLDYLVLSGNPYVSPSTLLLFFDFDTLVLASDNGWRLRRRWEEQCDSLHLPLIDISSNGGLYREL